jgi:hypothetical protein
MFDIFDLLLVVGLGGERSDVSGVGLRQDLGESCSSSVQADPGGCRGTPEDDRGPLRRELIPSDQP